MSMSSKLSGLTSKMATLSPFGRGKKEDADDVGEAVDQASVAGGGRASQASPLDKQLRVSNALRKFLASEGIVSPTDAGIDQDSISPALDALLHRQYTVVPPELLDPSFPLADYFISSSHNTYLLAHQLYGAACTSGYESTLAAGARCVEIDAWDSPSDPSEPKVTHGYTLTSNIRFREVCETIRDAIDRETNMRKALGQSFVPPILLSLENHCSPAGQKRLTEIMHEVFGERLAIVGDEADHVRLDSLSGKVCCIVEHYIMGEANPDSDSDTSDSEEGDSDDAEARGVKETEEDKAARKEYKEKRKEDPPTPIIPELAAIGVAASCKPTNTSWFEDHLLDGPLRHMINVSESALGKFLPAESVRIAAHNAKHMMRCYPHGLRIGSANLRPVPFWGIGAQVCALNWQTFGGSMQLNEALFSGTEGYVLKPRALRHGNVGTTSTTKKKLRLRIVGASDLAPRDKLQPYVTCTLVHPDDLAGKPPKRKTSGYKSSSVKWLSESPPTTEPVWDETLEWEYDDNDLTFLRVLLKSDDKFASNPTLAVAAIRLLYVQPGWIFLRLLDLQGHETRTTILVNLQIEDA